MNTKQPMITVLMGVYNGAKYLKESIHSVLNQTFSDFEFVIVNDGSTDQTAEILAAFAREDPRIVICTNEQNIGLTRSLNVGLKMARGIYIARQDADDISLPERFAKQVAHLQAYPEVGMLSTYIDIVDSKGQLIKKIQPSVNPTMIQWCLNLFNHIGGHGQVMYRRDMVSALDGYNEEYRCTQDYELWSRIKNVSLINIIPQTLMQWREHTDNISVRASGVQDDLSLKIARSNLALLLDRDVPKDQVLDLRRFWGFLFDEIKNHREMARLLKAVFQKFALAVKEPGDLTLIRQEIANRYFVWFKQGSSQKNVMTRCGFLLSVFSWQPLWVLKKLQRQSNDRN